MEDAFKRQGLICELPGLDNAINLNPGNERCDIVAPVKHATRPFIIGNSTRDATERDDLNALEFVVENQVDPKRLFVGGTAHVAPPAAA
jgi:hypothetical protein